MATTEHVLTRENIWALRDLIETSKFHHSYDPAVGRSELDGLEVWTLGARSSVLFHFGDAIRHH